MELTHKRILTQRDIPLDELSRIKPLSYSEYLDQGGYQALEKAKRTLKAEDILTAVRESGLRGRGGGGFPTSKKWEMVLSQKSPVRYLCINGAEDEPGTLKDRGLVRSNPHQLIEGAALSVFALGAQEGYLYVNGNFKDEIQQIDRALGEAQDQGHIGRPFDGFTSGIRLHIVKGPGTYIAGEETAVLSVIEGGAAKPREKPPYYPAVHGLFGKPTAVNNIETICNIPAIARLGAKEYKKIAPWGTMIFTLTGDVAREGLYERPIGTSLRRLIETEGGITNPPKAVFPGGPSNAILPWDKTDLSLDFEALKTAGSGLGTGAVMVFSEKRCMVKTAITYASFFARESCRQCPPCYLGLEHLTKILEAIDSGEGDCDDLIQLEQVCNMIRGRGVCYLLTGGVIAVESILRHFRDEFESHLHQSRCPFEA